MRSPKLYFIDVRLLLALLAWVFWPRLITFVPALATVLFLVMVGHRGYRPGAALRAVRRWLVGPPRALSPRRYRRMVDYGALASAGVLALWCTSARVEAEFLYIPPEAEALQTLAMAGMAPEDEALVRARLGEGTSVAMPVPRGRPAVLEEDVTPGPVAPETTTALGPQNAHEAHGVRALAESGWAVRSGSTLAQVLGEWGERAGVEVVMLTDRQYAIASSHVFTGAFVDAVRALFFGLGDLAYAPVAQVLEGGRVLAVYHRTPEGAQGG